MYGSYVKQVRDCCNCFECASDEEWENAVNVALTNWGFLTCGNWLDQHDQTLHIPLSKECGGCCPNVYTVYLPEEWVHPDTVHAYVRAWEGINPTIIEVPATYEPDTHDLFVDLTDAINCCNRCVRYELVVEYEVGLDEIPEEFCPWFCAVAKVYMQLNKTECASCGDLESVAIVEVDGTKDLSATIKSLAINYFQGLINYYSLCDYYNMSYGSVVR